MGARTPLPVPVPPMLEQALGYDHEHPIRWVSFSWEPAGDEAVYADGRRAGTGEWHAFLLYTRHRAVAPHLAGYDLGSSEAPARHHLVLDRRARRLYVAPAHEAARTCRAQWPAPLANPPSVEALTPADQEAIDGALGDFLAGFARVADARPEAATGDPRAGGAGVAARLAAQRRIEGALAAWLGDHAARP